MDDSLRRRILKVAGVLRDAAMLKEAITRTHHELQAAMLDRALLHGFDEEVKHKDLRPDVFRSKDRGGVTPLWWVGDAKVADNERPSHTETATRIRSYLELFQSALADRTIVGGIIAIATDEESAAQEWRAFLNSECRRLDLTTADGAKPAFTVDGLGEHFLIWW